MEFHEILTNLMNSKNLTAYKIGQDNPGITEAMVGKWKNGKSLPSYDKIKILSNYLDVSCDYLLTGKDPQQQINMYPQMIQKIIDNLLNMDEEDRAIIYGETIGILRSTKYSKNTSEAQRSENLSVG